jgi:hypothetical protein
MKVTLARFTRIGMRGSTEAAARQHFSSSWAQGPISFPSTTKTVAASSLRVVILSIADHLK